MLNKLQIYFVPGLVIQSVIVGATYATGREVTEFFLKFGPASALPLVDALLSEKSLKEYHLLPAVRGDLLAKLGRHEEARQEFTRAAGLTENRREKQLLLRRAGSGT